MWTGSSGDRLIPKVDLARDILERAGFGSKRSLFRIEIGFSNDVFSVDEELVLKIGKSAEDRLALEKEVFLCQLFAGRICSPEVVHADTSLNESDLPYIIYRKIPGDNLYTLWHLYSVEQRRKLVKEICDILRVINETDYSGFAARFPASTADKISDAPLNWHDHICSRIEHRLDQAEQSGAINTDSAQRIRMHVQAHHEALREQTLALTYYDPHFDNFLVADGMVTGILDFERTEIASIDYVLDLVTRMVRYPRKYVSAHHEHLIRDEDYADLLVWYREFYPEVFAFSSLEERLSLYLIEHSLSDLHYFPEYPSVLAELRALL
ncbi:MAG: aminoglycoside phosphotransferase family protein [Candidatus Obscuribacterales bacterium]